MPASERVPAHYAVQSDWCKRCLKKKAAGASGLCAEHGGGRKCVTFRCMQPPVPSQALCSKHLDVHGASISCQAHGCKEPEVDGTWCAVHARIFSQRRAAAAASTSLLPSLDNGAEPPPAKGLESTAS
jgi:hypothetical protein